MTASGETEAQEFMLVSDEVAQRVGDPPDIPRIKEKTILPVVGMISPAPPVLHPKAGSPWAIPSR